MEEILLNRLSTFAASIETSAENARILCKQYPWNKEQLEQSAITASKLQSILTRFNADLYQYFNMTTNPNADTVSGLTTSQLSGEETLAEINALIQQINKDTKVTEHGVTSRRSKLPELHLSKFKGDLLNWTPFWDQFQSSIGSRDMCNVDKLLYLKASLEGEPKTMIEGLETTNDSYPIAVETLQQRYGRPEQIIDVHYSTLYKIRQAVKFEDCRKTLDDIERHLRVLQAMGENTNHNHLRFLIMEKFPEDIVYEVKLKGGSESITELRKQLDSVITAKEEAKGYKDKNKVEEPTYTTEVLHIGENNRKRKFNKFKL